MTPPALPASNDPSAVADQVAVPTALLAAVGEQLRTVIGLDIERVGAGSVARAIRTAWPDAAEGGTETVGPRLAAGTDTWHRLIEAIVVSESWFLREPRVFSHAVAVVERILQQQPRATILSAPCAAGEEAYSLSLSLQQAGVAADSIRIVATDISTRAITAARRGSYTDNAFRATDTGLRSRWFQPTAEGWEVAAEVRQPVEFFVANLLDHRDRQRLLETAGGPFDLICCRNLLIYLTAAARQAVEHGLQQLLAPGGEVIVGAAEATILPVARWQPTGPLAFGRRPRGLGTNAATSSSQAAVRRRPPTQPHPLLAPALTHTAASQLPAKPAAVPQTAGTPPAPSSPLLEAEALANAGDIAAAIARCQQALEADAAQPAVLFLQAMLQQSQGKSTAAERLLEKVVYLEPDHEAALLALALAAGRRGDTAAERRYRRRAAAAAEAAS